MWIRKCLKIESYLTVYSNFIVNPCEDMEKQEMCKNLILVDEMLNYNGGATGPVEYQFVFHCTVLENMTNTIFIKMYRVVNCTQNQPRQIFNDAER